MFSKYLQVIEFGKVVTGTNIKCDRCHIANNLSYITYDRMDLCLPCVEIINNIRVNKERNKEPILLRMEIDIYKNEYINNFVNNSYPIKNISEFRIVDKVNDQFKVSINNKIYTMEEDIIIKNYWDYLSFYDKDYFMNK
jgi:hypothetical protein